MATVLLLLFKALVIFLGIYFFDYKVDGIVNNPWIIIASIVAGFLAFFLGMILLLKVTYYVFAIGRPKTSRLKHTVAKNVVNVALHLFNVRIKVIGTEHLPDENNFLIYSNHTSELDIPIIMNAFPKHPIAFLSKQAVLGYLGIGKWAVSLGCVMLDRENNRRGAEAIKQVISNVQTGSTMVVFPEGTFKREMGRLLKFRNGSFKVALEAGVPLVPLSLVRNEDYYKRKWPRPIYFKLVVHKPIPYEEIKELTTKELSARVRDVIKDELLIYTDN